MHIYCAAHAGEFLKALKRKRVEEFWAIALNPAKEVIRSKMIFRGTVDSCQVHPREVFRFACVAQASSLIVAHNHPSDDLNPSSLDLIVTQSLVDAGRTMQIPLIDHLIVTKSGFTSLADLGWVKFSEQYKALSLSERSLD